MTGSQRPVTADSAREALEVLRQDSNALHGGNLHEYDHDLVSTFIGESASRIAGLEAALKPFGDAYRKWIDGGYKTEQLTGPVFVREPEFGVTDEAEFTWEDLRHAAALQPTKDNTNVK